MKYFHYYLKTVSKGKKKAKEWIVNMKEYVKWIKNKVINLRKSEKNEKSRVNYKNGEIHWQNKSDGMEGDWKDNL